MQLVELLDKIDSSAPRCCETCRHMGTHAKCGGFGADSCLGDLSAFILGTAGYIYKFWEPGNWLRDIQAAEISGARNIVVGYSGEADFNAKDNPQDVAEHLHRVACDCGYSVGKLSKTDNCYTLRVYTDEEFVVRWDYDGKIDSILCDNNKRREWPRF